MTIDNRENAITRPVDIDGLLHYADITCRETIGEKALWQSVIMQAVLDVQSTPKNIRERVDRAKTLAWFSNQNPDFMMICSFAEMDAEHLIRSVRKIAQETKKTSRRSFGKSLRPMKKSLNARVAAVKNKRSA